MSTVLCNTANETTKRKARITQTQGSRCNGHSAPVTRRVRRDAEGRSSIRQNSVRMDSWQTSGSVSCWDEARLVVSVIHEARRVRNPFFRARPAPAPPGAPPFSAPAFEYGSHGLRKCCVFQDSLRAAMHCSRQSSGTEPNRRRRFNGAARTSTAFAVSARAGQYCAGEKGA